MNALMSRSLFRVFKPQTQNHVRCIILSAKLSTDEASTSASRFIYSPDNPAIPSPRSKQRKLYKDEVSFGLYV